MKKFLGRLYRKTSGLLMIAAGIALSLIIEPWFWIAVIAITLIKYLGV